MLGRARARGVYRELRRRALGDKLDFADEIFAAVVSFGVFTPGHAPASALDELVRITRPGGQTADYRPMPLSRAEATFTTRAYVYAVC
jgi:SAM-dependent methyltransferase